MPRLGWYGDDFTGATDTLACLAEAGLQTMLFLRQPTGAQLAAAGRLDAVGIAGASRAMAPDAMAAELTQVARFFAELGVPVLHYKCCSTFDSAPDIGSIGAAIRSLRPFFPNPFVPVLGGQPNIGRYCLFSTLFAAAGSGGEVHRLDRHPTMSLHPVTPMGEADLRRHLAAQGLIGVAAMHYPAYAAGLAELGLRLQQLMQDAPPAVLLDVASDADLTLLGELIWSRAQEAPLLAVGPSSVAQALVTAWPRATPAPRPPLSPATGPVFVMVGSLSPVTRQQVDASPSYTHLEIDAAAMTGDPARLHQVREQAISLLRGGFSVMVRTARPDHHSVEPAMIARCTASLAADIVRQARPRRIGIAGGDTSSHAALQLDLWGLIYNATLAPGVTLCSARSDIAALDGAEVMLKGGQMGPPDLFERLLHGD